MKLYRVYVTDPDEGMCLWWEGSLKAAQQRLRQEIAVYDDPETAEPSGIDGVEVPPGKAGLLRWLNKNLVRDNG